MTGESGEFMHIIVSKKILLESKTSYKLFDKKEKSCAQLKVQDGAYFLSLQEILNE